MARLRRNWSFSRTRGVIMKRGIFTSLAVLTLWGAGANFAAAQVQQYWGPLGQSPFPQRSVRPIDRNILQWQQNMARVNPDGSLQGQIDPNNPIVGLQTGHAATFFNYSHYYPANPPGGSGLAGTGGFGAGLG